MLIQQNQPLPILPKYLAEYLIQHFVHFFTIHFTSPFSDYQAAPLALLILMQRQSQHTWMSCRGIVYISRREFDPAPQYMCGNL
tara:strand:+ start:41 stop:292 length:252 start_codon:yes stop_codon:yes gene_type:complete